MTKRLLALALVAFAVSCIRREPWRWYSFRAPDGSFRIDFPYARPPHSRTGEFRSDYTVYGDRGQYMVEVFRDQKYSIANASELLRDYPNPGSGGIIGKVADSSSIHQGRYPGRAVRIEGIPNNVPAGKKTPYVQHLHRAFVSDGRLYLLTVAVADRPLPREADHFFNSFEILK